MDGPSVLASAALDSGGTEEPWNESEPHEFHQVEAPVGSTKQGVVLCGIRPCRGGSGWCGKGGHFEKKAEEQMEREAFK